MQATDPPQEAVPPGPQFRSEPRWDLAFVGILGYLFVEYMRLPLAYEALRAVYIGKVVIAIAALGWLLSPRPPSGDRSIARVIDIALVILLFGAFFSTLFAGHIGLAWDGYVTLVKWGLIYFFISRIVTSSWRMRIFIFLLILLNVKLARGGIRYFYATESLYNEAVAVREGAQAGSTGFFSNSADFGVAMCVIWPIAVMLLFARLKRLWRIFLLLSSLVFLFTILICGSRGAVVGAVCVVLVGAFTSRKKLAILAMALLMLPGIIFVIPDASKVRFKSAWELEGDRTAESRLVFWRAGLLMLRDHPVFGVGLENFPESRVEHYLEPGDPTAKYVAHSVFIEVLSELGLAGAVPVLALFVLIFRLNAKTRRHLMALGPEHRSSFEYCLTMGLDLGLVGYLASGAFVAVFRYPHLWVLLGISVGLHTACSRLQLPQTSPGPTPMEQINRLQAVAS
jgi:O-antigen ligase